MKENFKNVTNSHVYRMLLCKIYEVDWNKSYGYRKARQYKTWKYNRKTQYICNAINNIQRSGTYF
ncbi:hypothetical protein UFOVP129_14 [uncultured Caudovirales phage]|uniref:Uncharacterized protein n=1 Tax=uncultured Caudovirales phage TaxID=2100421 RepID=A0A6J5LBW2_9CAUD|nr:hypothetical protein UFOVP129_14 [uncultured Caudovirales phage]